MNILDTNVVSELFRPRPDPDVDAWLEAADPLQLFVTAVSKAELFVGVARMPEGRRKKALHSVMHAFLEDRLKTPILAFDSFAAEYYAEIVADWLRHGRPVGALDAQIASIAKSCGYSVLTRNVKDFEDCGVRIIQSVAAGMTLSAKRVLLVIGGGIAAYKALDLIRRLRERGAAVRCVMTKAAQQFVTPLSVGALSADRVFTDLFDRDDEHDVGHIRLSREADIIVVAPATADLMAKLSNGLADDLASAMLLATDKPVLIAPAMNPRMWTHPATRRNRATLENDGVAFVGPNKGEMAESGEAGEGRMAEPLEIVAAVERALTPRDRSLAGRRVTVTSGPTHEPIDPVRYIANRSSGKQGHAIAAALAALGADVRLVSGPVAIPDPSGVKTEHVETARQMKEAVEALLPADAAIFVAAVADWRSDTQEGQKLKKAPGEGPPQLKMVENPDILATIGHHARRPGLVIGFAAETQDLIANAQAKLKRKGADIIVANDVGGTGVMGGDRNRVSIVSKDGVEAWPEMSKDEVARKLAALVAARLNTIEV